MSTIIKSVLVPYPVDRAYDYRVPEGMAVSDGDYVLVPLGVRQVPGVVWGDGGGEGVAPSKLKDIIARFDVPSLPADHRAFLDWAARYTMGDVGSFLKLTLSVPAALDLPKDIKLVQIAAPSPNPLPAGEGAFDSSPSSKQNAVMAIAQDGIPRRPSVLAEESGVSAAIIKTMIKKGLLKEVMVPESPPCVSPSLEQTQKKLSAVQDSAAKTLSESVAKAAYSAFLLDGVTGSGKTEVYFEAVAKAIRMGKQSLIMLPEIALSNAFLTRFQDRFGCVPALWHSSLSDHQRKITWRGVAMGACKVVVGARSALFLPYQSLGVIIVDEEHDPAYKQEEGVIYNARDMAVVRASRAQCPVVMISATPSLETMHNMWNGKYQHLALPDRHGDAGMPDIHVIDLKKDKPERQHFIAPSLKTAMKDTMDEEGGQVLLFLNRRGYAPLTLCRNCGHRFECPRCTAWLIEHKKTGKLHCHHCGYDTKIPPSCPVCASEDSLVPCGPGIERILEEVKETFPGKSTMVLSSDTATTHDELKTMLSDIRDHKVDIVIGTQIIAKGHHFPKLTCVGIIDADLGLSGGDLRAGERTFQLLHQVAGRAGREADKGHVYLQTYAPESRVMQALASHNRDDFLNVEAGQREAANMPPYSRLAGIIVSGRDERMVVDVSNKLGQTAPHGTGLSTLGPADAPLYRLRGKFRRRLLIRADKTIDIQKAIDHWLGGLKIPSTVRVQIDIDPQSFF
jgi:primosomal protein N' (replication factor Y) (superfamily II helicase)